MMEQQNWYVEIIRPDWAPPAWLFGPVWSILYLLIAISFGSVLILWLQKKIKFGTVAPFLLNLIFNFLFTPIQFGLQNFWLAAIDIILVWITLVWAMVAIYRIRPWITWCQVPYLLWVSFATILQLTITFLN